MTFDNDILKYRKCVFQIKPNLPEERDGKPRVFLRQSGYLIRKRFSFFPLIQLKPNLKIELLKFLFLLVFVVKGSNMKLKLAKQTKLYTKLSMIGMTLLASSALWASDYYVAPTASGDCLSSVNACEFQTALDMARTNTEADTIHVASGTYNISSVLTYIPASGEDNSSLIILGTGSVSTILDGGNSASIMYINTTNLSNDSGVNISLTGITFQNGAGDGWGDASPEESESFQIRTYSADITLTDNVISDNGGYYIGGLLIRSKYGNIALVNNMINNNGASGAGGASLASIYGNISFTNNTVSRNYTWYGPGGVGIAANHGNATVVKNTFNENSGFRSAGGGLYVYSEGNTTLMSNSFLGNSSGRERGGGVAVHSINGSATLTNNIFNRNDGGNGGGAYISLSDGNATLINNTFVRNCANPYGRYGGGAYISTAKVELYNNIIWDDCTANSGEMEDSGLYVSSDIVKLYNNNIGPDADFVTGQSKSLYITNTGNYTQAANLKDDPLFVDADNGDFHLTDGSPLIDMGNLNAPKLPEMDFEGYARVIGDAPDIGAYEFTSVTIEGVLNFFDEAVDNGTLIGAGSGKSAEKRLNAYRNMLLEAESLLKEGEYQEACEQLHSVYILSDGNSKPKDLIAGDAISEWSAMIVELKASYGCE